MSFVLTAWKLAIFGLLMGAFFLWIAYTTPKGNRRLFGTKEVFFMFAVVYIAIAHFGMLTALTQSLDENYQAPCEWLLDNKTIDTINSTPAGVTDEKKEYYFYVDSCADSSAPPMSETLVIIFIWLLWAGFFSGVLFVMKRLVDWIRRFV